MPKLLLSGKGVKLPWVQRISTGQYVIVFPLYVAGNLFVNFIRKICHMSHLSSVICHLSSLSSLRSLSSLSRIRASIAMLAFRIDRTLNAGFAQVQTTNQA